MGTELFRVLLNKPGGNMNQEIGFEIAKFSDLNYEEMSVEVRYNGIPFAQINMDKGPDNQEITIPSRFTPEGQQFVFSLSDFLVTLEKARDLLKTLE